MKKIYMNLRLFAEGTAASGVAADSGPASQGTESTVVYGVQSEETDNGHPSIGTDGADPKKTEKRSFEDLIKGEYKQDFDARVKGIVEDRLKNAKEAEGRLKAYEPMMRLLAEKYGAEQNDVKAIMKALEDDDSFYEEEAARRGLTVKEVRELRRMERENEQLRAAIEQANRRQEEENEARALYAGWLQQSEVLKEKFPSFDLETEMKNPEFVQAMNVRGMTVEKAYMITHLDEIQPQLMKITADKVEEKVVNRIRARNERPSENGTAAYNAPVIRKTDPRNLNIDDIQEIERRVRRGEKISFG